METISSVIHHNLDINKYLENSNSCFLDIETTGLSRKYNMIYLIGLLYKDINSDTWILKQYFANNMDKEKELLKKFISDLSSFDKIVTYNGDSFDLPFIDHRLDYHGLNMSVDKSKSLDLYRIIRQNRQFLNLDNLKLKTIEESLGFFREDIYSGFDCIEFYYDYLKSKNPILKNNVLKHNYDDLVHMLDIMIILDVLDENKSFHINSGNVSIKFKIDIVQILGDMINITGSINPPLKQDIKYYAPNYNVVTKGLNNFKFSVEFKEGYITEDDICIYIDTSDFESLTLKGDTSYDLPDNIFILAVEKRYCVSNLKGLLTSIFDNLII